jgi:4-carboxymuconolactone decarboxylase
MADVSPRIEPLPQAEWDERLTRLFADAPGGIDEPMHLFTTLARAPDLFRRWLGFGGALLAGRLPGRIRELVILRTAHRFNGRYEWAHHSELGQAQGITTGEMAALGGDLAAAEWTPLEAAVLAAVDETADEGEISGGTWATLARSLDEAELVEVVMLVAHYLMLSTVVRSLELPLEPSAAALAEATPGGPPE